jgi:hypothetical protein
MHSRLSLNLSRRVMKWVIGVLHFASNNGRATYVLGKKNSYMSAISNQLYIWCMMHCKYEDTLHMYMFVFGVITVDEGVRAPLRGVFFFVLKRWNLLSNFEKQCVSFDALFRMTDLIAACCWLARITSAPVLLYVVIVAVMAVLHD